MKIRAYEIKVQDMSGNEMVVDCLPRNKEYMIEQLKACGYTIISITGM
jgi:hypothetical protein